MLETLDLIIQLRRMGSNHRPIGYEPIELPLLYRAIYAKIRYAVLPITNYCKNLYLLHLVIQNLHITYQAA